MTLMTFASLAATQWLSYSSVQSGVSNGYLTPTGTAIPVSDQWVPKHAMDTYIVVNYSNPYWAAKSTDQWIAKRDVY